MIGFSDLFLLTKDAKILSSFISFLFDLPAEINEQDQIVFKLPNVRVVLAESSKNISKKKTFRLKATDLTDMHELQQKIEFFSYKNHMSLKPAKMRDSELTFYDPDGREWTVILDSFPSTHEVASNSLDVRRC